MIRSLFTLMLLIAVCLNVHGQRYIKNASKKLKKSYLKAAQEAQQNNYPKALKYCNDILSKEPDNIDALLRKGSFLNSMKQFSEAEASFQEAINYDPQKIDQRAYYSLALSQFNQENYNKATPNLEKFITEYKGSKGLLAKAKSLLEKSKFRAIAINNPVPFKPERLNENINTELLEYLPYITADGQKMIYLTKLDNTEELFVSEIKNGEYSKGELFKDFDYPTGEGAHCISADGRTLVFTSCDYSNSPNRTSYGGCDLYISYLVNEQWSFPKNLGPDINSRYWESQPSLSSDGKKLYFSSKRRGGLGGADLYYSELTNQGEWVEPKNLGDLINTAGDDESPFVHPDNQTLYFRTNGRPGMGDFDIFFAKWDEEKTTWNKVKNIGYPINTAANDGALFVNLQGTKAYYTSDRYSLKNNLKPNLDIYSFELYPEARPVPTTYVKGIVKDAVTDERISADIQLSSTNYNSEITSDKNGEFLISLPAFKDYSFHVSQKNYLLSSDRFELKEVSGSLDPFQLEISLWPIPKAKTEVTSLPTNQAIPLKNILFESGSAVLLSSSFFEINKLFEMLQNSSQLKIEIHGHTDNVGSEADNMKLSDARAKSVHDALIEKGIERNRISFKGFGETIPIAGNESEAGRKLNRRTEFVIK